MIINVNFGFENFPSMGLRKQSWILYYFDKYKLDIVLNPTSADCWRLDVNDYFVVSNFSKYNFVVYARSMIIVV